jgi:DNA mismatch repair protein MutS2
MDNHTLKDLEFHKIIEILRGLTVSSLGADAVRRLRPVTDMETVERKVTETMELQGIITRYGDIPLHSLKDIRGPLSRVSRENCLLHGEEFLLMRDTLETVKVLREFFIEKEIGGLTGARSAKLVPLPELLQKIDKTFDREGIMKDSASKELSRIRKEIIKIREEIRKLLEKMLTRKSLAKAFSDTIITMRDGRYVLAVKREFQSLIPGIVHDESNRGFTYFIEPMESLDLNNKLSVFIKRGEEEERRILQELTELVGSHREELSAMVQELTEWDSLYAKARLGILLKSTQPGINSDGTVDLKEARHPLIEFAEDDRAVPINVTFGKGRRILVISGANAGGKTVSLKTVGLITLMLQSGMTVPVDERSNVTVFNKVLADLGDEQSIEERMSTFSAHLKRVGMILDSADSHSLVLIDEIGTGTDPVEGSALAISFLEALKTKNSHIIVTTHYPQLKAFAHTETAAENLSVEFDTASRTPTYRLLPGIPGASNALSVAESYGIPRNIVAKARTYVSEGDKGLSDLIQSLKEEREAARKEREKTEALKASMESVKKRREKLLKKIDDERNAIIEKVREDTLAIKKKFREKAKGIVSDLEEGRVRSLREAESKIEGLHRELFQEKAVKKATSYKPALGETIFLRALNEVGMVKKVGLKGAEVQTDKFTVKVGFDEIEPLPEKCSRKTLKEGRRLSQKVAATVSDSFDDISFELNLIGLRVEEAIQRTDRFIDRALLKGFERIDIIHGVGEGKLKKALQEYLDLHRGVKSFETGIVNPGVTTVWLGEKSSRKRSHVSG